ncbi:MAG: T9SS type A sorting domain-containing protein, partial [Janthinobacterium lividum]
GTSPVLDLEQGSYSGGQNPLSGEIGTLAVYSGLLSASERTAWFASAPVASATSGLTAFAVAASGADVNLDPAAASLALYPNPAHTATRLQNAAPNAAVQLLNGLGIVVATTTTDATGTAELVLPAGLPAGIYLVRQGNMVSRLEVQ